MDEHDEPGSLIGVVLASLVERVTALEQNRRPNVRPSIIDEDEDIIPGRQMVTDRMAEMYKQGIPMIRIARKLGYDVKTVRTYLTKAGLRFSAAKETT